jgi:hypothetical protein
MNVHEKKLIALGLRVLRCKMANQNLRKRERLILKKVNENGCITFEQLRELREKTQIDPTDEQVQAEIEKMEETPEQKMPWNFDVARVR